MGERTRNSIANQSANKRTAEPLWVTAEEVRPRPTAQHSVQPAQSVPRPYQAQTDESNIDRLSNEFADFMDLKPRKRKPKRKLVAKFFTFILVLLVLAGVGYWLYLKYFA